MKTALGSPWPSSTRSPDDMESSEVDLYRPGPSVCPPMFPATGTGAVVLPAASLNAIVRSASAALAAGSVTCLVPTTLPGGKPATEVPGQSPRSPVTTVAPLLVTVEAASTPKLAAEPRLTGNSAAGE